MNRINYIKELKGTAIQFKKEGRISELAKIQGELASIASGFEILKERDASEAALEALKAIEGVSYPQSIEALKMPSEAFENVVSELYAKYC